jgi:predicted small lipoprotein YifL
MHKTPLLAAAASAALFMLSACGQSGPEMVNTYDPQAEALQNAAPVTAPPPMISANKTYRCADNSLFYVDFYTNNTATIRTTQSGATTQLTQTGGAGPYTGNGQSVSGNESHVTINGKSCHT